MTILGNDDDDFASSPSEESPPLVFSCSKWNCTTGTLSPCFEFLPLLFANCFMFSSIPSSTESLAARSFPPGFSDGTDCVESLRASGVGVLFRRGNFSIQTLGPNRAGKNTERRAEGKTLTAEACTREAATRDSWERLRAPSRRCSCSAGSGNWG